MPSLSAENSAWRGDWMADFKWVFSAEGLRRWLPCISQWEATREVWTLAKVLGESQEVIEVRTCNSTHKQVLNH